MFRNDLLMYEMHYIFDGNDKQVWIRLPFQRESVFSKIQFVIRKNLGVCKLYIL